MSDLVLHSKDIIPSALSHPKGAHLIQYDMTSYSFIHYLTPKTLTDGPPPVSVKLKSEC